MALFTGQDKTLPILSRVVQVEDAEVRQFLMEEMAKLTDDDPSYIKVPGPIDECWFRELRDLSRGVLRNLVEKKLTSEQVTEINEMLLRYPVSRRIVPKENFNKQVFCVPEDLAEHFYLIDGNLGVFQHITERLYRACFHPERVRLCIECGNPFLGDPRKKEQQYCSHLHAHRAGVRRRRRESKRGVLLTS